jgi:homoserine kinase
MDKITVFSPATVANVACGFDVMGFALNEIGDTITITKTDSSGITITNGRGCDGLPTQPEQNVVGIAAQALLRSIDFTEKHGFNFHVSKNVKAGSGLGSSASSAAAAVFALNQLLGKPFSKMELVNYAMEGERASSGLAHADNVAPSLLGGFTLVRSYHPLDIIQLDYPEDLFISIVHPQIEIKTADSKKILKRQVEMKDAITQWGNVGGLVAGLARKDFALIGRCLQDVIAEPVRSVLIPFFAEAKQAALNEGALGASISGSGPSIFALSDNKRTAEMIAIAFNNVYACNDIYANVYISQINRQGAVVKS